METHIVSGPCEYDVCLKSLCFSILLWIHEEIHSTIKLYQYMEYGRASICTSSHHTDGQTCTIEKCCQCN